MNLPVEVGRIDDVVGDLKKRIRFTGDLLALKSIAHLPEHRGENSERHNARQEERKES